MKSRSKVVQTGQRIMAGMLSSHTFSPERIEEWNRKIKKRKVLFKMKVFRASKRKERVIDEMYQEDCKSLRKHKKSWKKNASGFKMCMNG